MAGFFISAFDTLRSCWVVSIGQFILGSEWQRSACMGTQQKQALVAVLALFYTHVRFLDLNLYWPSALDLASPAGSASCLYSSHSGRGISMPSTRRPYVIPPSLDIGRRICSCQ